MLHHLRLLLDAEVFVGDVLIEEPLPLRVAQLEAVEGLNLRAEVDDEGLLALHVDVFVALLHQLLDEGLFQGGLALVATLYRRQRFITAHYGAVRLLGYDVYLLCHLSALFKG